MIRVQRGFTLIELMIVVAIVGILAAIALPAYQDYVVRSKMSEAVAAMAACKTSVQEYFSTNGASMTGVDSKNGCSTTATQYVASLSVATSGAITAATTAAVGASGCSLTLTPTVTGTEITAWTGSTNCNNKYVPSNFRS